MDTANFSDLHFMDQYDLVETKFRHTLRRISRVPDATKRAQLRAKLTIAMNAGDANKQYEQILALLTDIEEVSECQPK